LSKKIKDLSINGIEDGFILGCLLGDATLSTSGKHYRLRVEQKSAHKEYVDWKFAWLKRLCITSPQFNKKNNSYRFGTVGHPAITKIHETFFDNDHAINSFILDRLSPLSIAVWFMDDGYKIHKTVGISANNFYLVALQQLINLLAKYGISTSLQKDKQGKRIYIKTSSYKTFYKLVKPYVDQVKCMAYKLPNPVETTRKLPGNWDEDIVQSP